MKRLLTALLAICMVFGLVACASEKPQETYPYVQVETLPAAVAPEVPVVTQPQIIETEPIETEAPETDPPATEAAESALDEVVVYDDGTFKLTAKGIDYSGDYSVDIKFLAENTSDRNVSFSGDYFTINGITMYCFFYAEVAAGKKANCRMEINRDYLEAYGIDQIATIVAHDTRIYDSDEYDTIADFQFSLATSIADTYQQVIDDSGEVIYDQDGIVIKYRGIIESEYSGEELMFYVENNTDRDMTITVDNVSVNGFMVYGFLTVHAYSGCVAYETMDFSTSDMEENEIETIEEVGFTLRAYDPESYRTIWETDEIVITR